MIVEFKIDNGKYVTPWGHEFDTKKEFQAFVLGMQYMATNMIVNSEYLLEKVNYTEKVQ